MAWARRGTQMYYYESVRVDGRATKIYYGSGPAAELAAAAVARRHADRAAAAKGAAADRREMESIEATLDELDRVLRALVHARLRTLGYHQHARGAWRLKRHGDAKAQLPDEHPARGAGPVPTGERR